MMEEMAVEQTASGSPVPGLLIFVASILLILGGWKMFAKAGKPGWAILIPIYSTIVTLQIAQKPVWWIFLLLVPVVNFVIPFLMCIAVAKNFGKGAGFGVGLTLLSPIFIMILGFGSATYEATPPAMPA